MSQDFCFMGISELACGYRSGAFSPVEVTEAVLAQIDHINPLVNAIVARDADRALAEGRRGEAVFLKEDDPLNLFRGIRVRKKDLIWTKPLPTGSGPPLYRGHRPPEAAPAVARLKEAGAIILGK